MRQTKFYDRSNGNIEISEARYNELKAKCDEFWTVSLPKSTPEGLHSERAALFDDEKDCFTFLVEKRTINVRIQ